MALHWHAYEPDRVFRQRVAMHQRRCFGALGPLLGNQVSKIGFHPAAVRGKELAKMQYTHWGEGARGGYLEPVICWRKPFACGLRGSIFSARSRSASAAGLSPA
jgi:hypothetical protein